MRQEVEYCGELSDISRIALDHSNIKPGSRAHRLTPWFVKWVICEAGGIAGLAGEKNELDEVEDAIQDLPIVPSVCTPNSHPAILMPARRGNGADRLTISVLIGVGAATACKKHGSRVRNDKND